MVLSRLLNTSVRLNGVLLPAGSLQSALGRYVDQLVVWNGHDVHKVSLVGSAVLLKFADRYLMVCSSHQLRGVEKENVSLLDSDGKNLVTSTGACHFDNEDNPFYVDLAVFNFTAPCNQRPELKERFFDFRDVPPDAPSTDIIFAIVSGFPSKEQTYELEERNHIRRFKRIVACGLEDDFRDGDQLCLRAFKPIGFDPDGMSGGSAFVVQQVNNEFRAYFAGMVVTGGGNLFRIVKVGVIASFLRAVIRQGW